MPSHIDKKIVVSQHFLATIIGKSIFEKGGNAFDVAITASSLVSLLLPHTSGLGGDAFLLAYTPEGLIAYNASGWAPKNVKPFTNPRDVGTVLVPGLVDLWDFINSSHYNKLSLEQDLTPAISLARNGFNIGRELSNAITKAKQDIADYDWHKLFGDKHYGDRINFPQLAEILGRIAKEPRDFYEGKTAEDLVTGLNNKGLLFELSDFSEYKGEKVTPLRSSYRDFALYELPPNSQGITTLQLLKLIEISDINRNREFFDAERVKAHLELTKIAYKDRDSYVTDPRFAQVPINMLLSENYLTRLIKSLPVSDVSAKQDGDTTFLIAADEENIVAVIQSLFYPFGSGIVVNNLVFNNRGYSFTHGVNKPGGRKRPLHTLSILYVSNDKETLVIGCAGAYLRPQIHAEVLEYYVDYNKELDNAVYAPRFMLSDEGVLTEVPMEFGKTVNYPSPAVGIVQAIKKRNDNIYIGVSDIRAEGLAL